MSCHSEAGRRAVAAASAVAVCLVVAGLVGEAGRFLATAYGIRQSQTLTADAKLHVPGAQVAESRVVPAAVPTVERRVAPVRPPVPRRKLSPPQAFAAVMSHTFPYRRTVLKSAARHAVDPSLVFAIIASESQGDPEAVSPCGAIGLMQLMPTTAVELGVDPWKPEENIEGAVRYLSALLEQFKSVDLSLVAYNAGPGFAERYRQGEVDLGAETRAFLMRVAGLQ